MHLFTWQYFHYFLSSICCFSTVNSGKNPTNEVKILQILFIINLRICKSDEKTEVGGDVIPEWSRPCLISLKIPSHCDEKIIATKKSPNQYQFWKMQLSKCYLILQSPNKETQETIEHEYFCASTTNKLKVCPKFAFFCLFFTPFIPPLCKFSNWFWPSLKTAGQHETISWHTSENERS